MASTFKANAALCCPLLTEFLLLTDVDRKSNLRKTPDYLDIMEGVNSDIDFP